MKNGESKENFYRIMRILIAVLLLATVIVASYISFLFCSLVFSDEPMTVQRIDHISYDITVREGESTLEIGKELEENGIIRNAWVFLAQSKVYECTFGPGTYSVSSRYSSKEIAKLLSSKYRQSLQENTK